jgi:hypothetical protein
MVLQNNVVGYYDALRGARRDVLTWNPAQSDQMVIGTVSLHDGPISLADEQAQWVAWHSKLAANGVAVGP